MVLIHIGTFLYVKVPMYLCKSTNVNKWPINGITNEENMLFLNNSSFAYFDRCFYSAKLKKKIFVSSKVHT